MMVTTKNYKR